MLNLICISNPKTCHTHKCNKRCDMVQQRDHVGIRSIEGGLGRGQVGSREKFGDGE